MSKVFPDEGAYRSHFGLMFQIGLDKGENTFHR